MMKYAAACYLIAIQVSMAQNLVPNPGFEEYVKCPVTFSTDPKFFGPTSWSSASQGTPDYFNKCSISEMDVPQNWAGVSYAHAGVGYAGIYAWSASNRSYREYVQCKLSEPLKKGATYDIQFYYRLSSYSVWAIDRIGLALSTEEVKVNYDTLLDIKPVLTRINPLEKLTNEWYRASGKIKAEGGEQFLIIGNFSNNNDTESAKIEYREGKSLMLGSSAYYYIDDVSVLASEIPGTEVDTLSLSWQPVIKPNETYILKHIHFSFNSYELLPSSFEELNRLIIVLKKNPKWKVELSGHTDDQGTDEYNLKLSQNRAVSVGEYLVQNGVSADRIRTMGFGKQRPIHESTDDKARATNRRVEAKFFD